jgi:hypothetical protein
MAAEEVVSMRKLRYVVSHLLLCALICAAGSLAGCSRWLEYKSGRAASGILEAARAEENRRRMQAILTSEELQESTRVLTRAVLDAALADLGEEELQGRLHELAAGFADGLGPALGRTLDTEVLPRVRRELVAGVEEAVDAALERTLAPGNRERFGAVAGEVARAAMESVSPRLTRALSDGVSEGVDRSVRAALDRDVSPAVGRALDANTAALARAMRAGTEAAFLGAADALRGDLGQVIRDERMALVHELERVAEKERVAWLAGVSDEVERSRQRWVRGFVVLAAITGLAALAGGYWLVRLAKENRRLKAGA